MAKTLLATALALVLPIAAAAQEPNGHPQKGTRLKLPSMESVVAASSDGQSANRWETARKTPTPAHVTVQQTTQPRERSVGRRILGGALGGVGGLFAGGYLGAKIEGDGCHCDDPGLMGALIGAPIGAVAGAILGAMFF